MNTFLLMCWEFFKTGLFAVGGGLATVPFLQEMSIKYGWFTLDMLTTMIAVSESTPGPIGINMSTYVGYDMFGLLGAFAATISLVTPSVIVICLVAKAMKAFQNSRIVHGIFNGLRPAVVGFILSAVLSIFLLALFHVDAFKASKDILQLFNWKALILFAGLFAFYKWKPKLHPLWLIMISAAVGIIIAL